MATSEVETSNPKPSRDFVAEAASELNNLLQIIAGSSSALERVAKGDQQASEYLEMLRASIERAEMLGLEMAKQGGGASEKLIRPLDLSGSWENKRSESPADRVSILVVDDERMALTLMERVLREAGYDVVLAESGFQCLDLFRSHPYRFALVLLDLSLPFMDGEETFRRLRQIRNEIPVVLCTGFILQDRLTAMLDSGLTGFVRKPVPPNELLGVVRSTLQSAMYSRATCEPLGISLAS